MNNAADKRRSHRVECELPLVFQPPESLEEEMAFGITVDLSATGMCFLTKEPLMVGQKLPLKLQLPKGERLMIHVEVIRVETKKDLVFIGGFNEFKVGVKIIDPILGDEIRYVHFFAEILREKFEQKPPSG